MFTLKDVLPDLADACCVGYDPELWFAVPNETGWKARQAQAKQICAGCPALEACRVAHRFEPFGIFAGQTPDERGFTRQGLRKDKIITPPDWPARAASIVRTFLRTGVSVDELAARYGVLPLLVREAIEPFVNNGEETAA